MKLTKLLGKKLKEIRKSKGFTQQELELAKAYKFNEVTLGKRILRAETAAIALMAIIAFQLNELN